MFCNYDEINLQGYEVYLNLKRQFGASRLMYNGVGCSRGQTGPFYYGYLNIK